jgi:hypothetical protein
MCQHDAGSKYEPLLILGKEVSPMAMVFSSPDVHMYAVKKIRKCVCK